MIEAEPARLGAGGARPPRRAGANPTRVNGEGAASAGVAEWLAMIGTPDRSGDHDAASAQPFFDLGFWRESLSGFGLAVGQNPTLQDYFERPETWCASPHPLFDPAHYADQLARLSLAADPSLPPLADMLQREELVSCHYLFEPGYYARQAEVEGAPLREHPWLHYVRGAGRTGLDPHPLFDTAFYLAGSDCEIPASSTPLEHFLAEGSRKGRDPSPLFSQRHYGQQFQWQRGEEFEALKHYLDEGGRALLDPHPRFEAAYYAVVHPHCLDGEDTPLAHYVRSWLECGYRCPPWGSTLATRHGRGTDPRVFDIVLVSHELTQTGAPKILLKIAQHLAKERGQSILVISAQGGVLLEEFREWASVFDLSAASEWGVSPIELTTALCESMSSRTKPRFAIVNTACVSRIGAVLGDAGIAMVTLVHELASGFSKDEFEAIYEASALVIYPAEFVRAEAHETFSLPTEKSRVLPQGLLDPKFGQGDPQAAREALLAEIGASEDAFLVLGCGTLDLRKGVDIFVRTAAATQASRGVGARPVHFVWVGGGDEHAYTPCWYARQDVVRGGLEGSVHFLGSRVETEPYFLGCDAFAVTSRMDPFPCVVHEAMACSKPVIAFENAGGAPEALAAGAGVVVPYGDSEAMARVIGELADDEVAARELGSRAFTRVREAYAFFDYVEKIVTVAGSSLAVDLPDRRERRDSTGRGRVLFALGNWRPDPVVTFTERLARGLQDRGFEPEIVFTRRGAIHCEPAALPRVPYRFLISKQRERLGFLARCERLERSVRAAAPAIYVHDLDLVGSAIAPILPKDVGVLGILHESGAEQLEQAERIGRYWQRTIAATPAVVRRFAEAFPERAVATIELSRGAPNHGALVERAAGGPLRIMCAAPPTDRHDLTHFLRSVFSPFGRDEGLDYVLTLVGVTEEHQNLRLVFADEASAGVVRFAPPGSERDLVSLLRESDVMLTLDTELGALDLPEVMSLGTIVVAAFGHEPPWIGKLISDGANGYLVALRRPAVCREVLGRLCSDWDLRAKVRRAAFDTGRAAVVDMELVCDSYAEVLDGMLADIAGGRYAKPTPTYFHPMLGGLSLSPALIDNPDRAPGWVSYDKVIPDPGAGGIHPGWVLVHELGPHSNTTTFGGAGLSWGGGVLEVAKPDGDGGIIISLDQNASHQLMVRLTLRADESGTATLYTQTIAETDFTNISRIDCGFDAGSDRQKLHIARDASIRALRLVPREKAGRFLIEKLAVFAPAVHGWEDEQIAVLPAATPVEFRFRGDAEEYVAGGWYAPEPDMRWSHGADGRVRFRTGEPTTGGVRLWVLCRVAGTAALGPIEFELRMKGGGTIETWVFPDDGWCLRSTALPAAAIIADRAVEILFHSDDVEPLDTLGLVTDPRHLGLGVRAMALLPATTALSEVEAVFKAAVADTRVRLVAPGD